MAAPENNAKSVRKDCTGCCTRLADFGVKLGDAQILSGINLHSHCGELTAIIGPNGGGKTTLFRAMLGEVPHAGELLFTHADGAKAFGVPRIGYVPQKLELDRTSPISVLDLFAAAISRRPLWLGRGLRIRNEARKALSMAEAEQLLENKLAHLSCGQLQRVLLALALVPMPDILLLDEPVAGVDRAGIAMFYRTVSRLRRDYDISILLISHDLSEVALVADRIVFLNHTILANGMPQEVLSSACVREAFGMDAFLAAKEAPVPRTEDRTNHHLAAILHVSGEACKCGKKHGGNAE